MFEIPNGDHFLKRLKKEEVLYLNVKVIPQSQKTEFVEMFIDPDGEEIIRMRVAAVPEKGKANAELCRYLAKVFGVSRSSVDVVHGKTSPRKVVKILLQK